MWMEVREKSRGWWRRFRVGLYSPSWTRQLSCVVGYCKMVLKVFIHVYIRVRRFLFGSLPLGLGYQILHWYWRSEYIYEVILDTQLMPVSHISRPDYPSLHSGTSWLPNFYLVFVKCDVPVPFQMVLSPILLCFAIILFFKKYIFSSRLILYFFLFLLLSHSPSQAGFICLSRKFSNLCLSAAFLSFVFFSISHLTRNIIVTVVF